MVKRVKMVGVMTRSNEPSMVVISCVAVVGWNLYYYYYYY